MRIVVQSRTGRELVPGGLELPDAGSVNDLQQAIHRVKSKLHVSRQRLTLPPPPGEKRGTVLAEGKLLSDYELRDGSIVLVKDLGPQVAWKTVFLLEYLGPLLIYPLIYDMPNLFYPGQNAPDKTLAQTLFTAYYCVHYAKRILETLLVHRFSHGTMPIFNLFKNCTYYWGFSAYISYFINHPLYTAPPPLQSYIGLGVAMLFQLANLRCHLILANLRPAGSKEYKIPSGFLFNYITCANYFTEIMGWVCFTIATQTLGAAFFTLAGTVQMMSWAAAKHRRLRKLFDGKDGRPKYPRRWIMLPPFF